MPRKKKPSKLGSKYDFKKLAKAKKLTELELNALFRKFNNGDSDLSKELRKLFNNNKAIYDATGIKLDKAQSDKGFKWLKGIGFTPKGKERSNSPFGPREEYIIQNPKEIRLRGYYDAGNMFNSYYIPLYEAIGKDGTTMEYYVSGGKPSIVG